MSSIWSYFLLFIFFSFYSIYLIYLNYLVPEPYMDEIFHITQTQEYCAGNWYIWNDKITTPPGLYIFSAIIPYLLRVLFSATNIADMMCSVVVLRLWNVGWFLGICWQVFQLIGIIGNVREKKVGNILENENKQFWKMIDIVVSPILFFFVALFYTDLCSLFWVLASLNYSFGDGYRSMWISALCAFFSVCIRQNNIVWAGYISCYYVFRRCTFGTGFLVNCWVFFKICLAKFLYLFPFLTLVIVFVMFVILNNGIVLGDQSNHVVAFHFVQVFYFVVFLTFTAPFTSLHIMIKSYKNVLNLLKSKFALILLCLVIFIIYKTTMSHPFLLADNRHYTYFIWRYAFQKISIMKYVYSCLYLFGFYLLFTILKNNFSHMLLYSLCTMLVLIPSPLIECRYFLIPLVLFKVHEQSFDVTEIKKNVSVSLLVNAIMLYIFLFKSYQWVDESEARLMW